MTSACHQEGRTQRSRHNRSYAIAAVLAVVALVAGGAYALWSGKFGGIIALAPKSAQDTLTEAMTADPAAIVKTVFDQIGASPSDGELAAARSLRREQGVEADLNGDDRGDYLGIYSVPDADSRDFFAVAALTQPEGDARITGGAFIGTDLQLDAPKASGDQVRITGAVTTANSVNAAGDNPGEARPFEETILANEAGELRVQLEKLGESATGMPAARAAEVGQARAESRTDAPTFHATGPLRFGQPVEISVHVPETHSVSITNKSGEPISDLAVTVVDEQGQQQHPDEFGEVPVVGDARVRLASDHAPVTMMDVLISVIPDPMPSLPNALDNLASYDSSGRPVVYLTFDDGPSEYTPQVLDVLAKHDAHATFFMIGAQATNQPAMVQRVRDAGHAVGNHSWSHPDFTELNDRQLRAEIAQTDDAVGGAQCVRPPYGATDDHVRDVLSSMAKSQALWTVDSEDWRRPGVDKIVDRVLADVRPGSVVLMHDGGGAREQSVAALDKILNHLDSQGYVALALPSC
ncbi:polysaccharide deacetylase family protein [uncultured Gulosibacter sp.]|uniref:polysaccharide deacetylase family protein n=1 Tax=uncultured Gulosibacter sp. TaxID=1339167 RepID=UPI00288AF5F8|nr:polysaccharide deacetylase family protein [uncultured Gulosibacter sp.]